MVTATAQIFCQLIEIEEDAAKLYRSFGVLYPADSILWYQLAVEEDQHANLLRMHRKSIEDLPASGEYLLATPIETLYRINSRMQDILLVCGRQPTTRGNCFAIALQIEQSLREIHLQNARGSADDAMTVQIFHTLTTEDSDHANRIRRHMGNGLWSNIGAPPLN
jgi:hypothetical protein